MTPDETAAALTSIGLETGGVEEVQTIKGGLEGLVVLTAKSKIGKSWLALQLAVAVANGSDCLGFNTTQGDVLYICLLYTSP